MVQLIQPIQRTQGRSLCLKMAQGKALSGFQEELQRQIDTHKPQEVRCSSPSLAPKGGRGLIHLGTISQKTPTVSHLLVSHPEYHRDCWKIVHSEINSQKAFRSLCEGEDIFIDPDTMELVWGDQAASARGKSAAEDVAPPDSSDGAKAPEQKHASFQDTRNALTGTPSAGFGSGSLVSALKQYMGTPYQRLNCYEFVVEGLKEMGVRYGGQGGLQDHLIHAAVDQGLPMNAYLTGNGLIEASSTTVFDRTIAEVEGTQSRADQLWEDLKPHLEQGLILSFSTGGRGHTGVVSRYGNRWTFLNSGDLDNDVRSATRRKGVGEEDLRSELSNWLRGAERRGEPLRITLGRLNRDKLMAFLNGPSTGRTI